MSKQVTIELIADKLPVKYRYKQFVRWSTLFLSAVIVAYCLFFMTYFFGSDTPTLAKVITIAVLFVAIQSIVNKLMDVNSLTFEETGLKIGYIGRMSKSVDYTHITEIRLDGIRSFSMIIHYLNYKGNNKSFTLKQSFPHKPEILLNIVELSPNAKTSEEIKKVVEVLKQGALQSVRYNNLEKE